MGEECSTHLRNDNWVQIIRRYQFWGLGVDGGDNIEMNLRRVNWNQFVQQCEQWRSFVNTVMKFWYRNGITELLNGSSLHLLS